MKICWGLSDEDYQKFLNQMFAGVPKNFSGRLLEIPVGTGVFSLPLYKNFHDAEIFCVDYSKEMLAVAKERARRINLSNVFFQRGDVASLPYPNENFDLILSINGFHVFPDKNSAYCETFRALKRGGIFCGCTYIVGQNFRTDFFVRNFCDRFSFFTPPHETLDSLEDRLKKIYARVEITNVKSFAGFVCRK